MHISIVHSDYLRPQRLPAQNEAYSKMSGATFFTEARSHCFSNQLWKSKNIFLEMLKKNVRLSKKYYRTTEYTEKIYKSDRNY